MLLVDAGLFAWVVFLGCLIVELALVYLDLTINWWQWSDSGPIRRLFNTTREDGLASWFAVSQTLVVALVAWLLFTILLHQNTTVWRRAGWLIIALFFSYMCIDDGAMVHERLGSAFKETTDAAGLVTYAWHYVLLPFFVGMGVFILAFLWREMPVVRARLMILAALGCFGLAVGMDFVEGMDDGYRVLVDATGWKPATVRHFSKSLEEFLEMVGMSLFLAAFIGHLAAVAPSLQVRFVNIRTY